MVDVVYCNWSNITFHLVYHLRVLLLCTNHNKKCQQLRKMLSLDILFCVIGLLRNKVNTILPVNKLMILPVNHCLTAYGCMVILDHEFMYSDVLTDYWCTYWIYLAWICTCKCLSPQTYMVIFSMNIYLFQVWGYYQFHMHFHKEGGWVCYFYS